MKPVFLLLPLLATSAQAAPVSIRLSADRAAVLMGRTVLVTATVRRNGAPAAGVTIWPYVNGRRWGADGVTNARGRALLMLPLPRPGAARIQAIADPPKFRPDASWIWTQQTADNQAATFRKAFSLPRAPRAARLTITADNTYSASLNGHEIATGTDWSRARTVTGLEKYLRAGENVLTVEARNVDGPAGLLARLTIQTPNGRLVLPTDATWRVKQGDSPPAPASVVAPVGGGAWQAGIQGWPALDTGSLFPVGSPMAAGGVRSNAVTVRVDRRRFAPRPEGKSLIGLEWEPWFTPKNARWDTAEAISVLGRYDSKDRDVIRQHALWFADMGIDFLLVDWSNNLWDKAHWSERAPNVVELVDATTVMLDEYAKLRAEGIPVPKITLLLGLNNGPTTTTEALSEEARWVHERYVTNPRYKGLWLYHEGKPLIVPFNGAGPAFLAGKPPFRAPEFTVRWMGTQFQASRLNEAGYWSWMDGVLHPVPTYRNGRAEALTITPAFFGKGGWTYPEAMGRLGGATWVEQFRFAARIRPRFLLLNQWNEFAGQAIGGGYGEKRDQYYDSYDAERSNDIEPTSLTACAYRGCGGWGYYYLNLTRALADAYRARTPRDTVLAVASPARGAALPRRDLRVEWSAAGRLPKAYTVALDGRTVASGLRGTSATLPARLLTPGAHRLTVRADGCATHYLLSWTREDDVLARPVPAAATVPFTVKD